MSFSAITDSHTGKKTHKCDTCNKTFEDRKRWKRHKRVHSGEKPHKCDTCDRDFSSTSNLRQHIRTHTGEKPYRCPDCDKPFTDRSSRERHRIIHSGKKPYKCDTCDRDFSCTSNLRQHIRTHTGVKPYRCPDCDKTFTTGGSRNRHQRKALCQHKEKKPKPFRCSQDNESFAQLGDPTRHSPSATRKKTESCPGPRKATHEDTDTIASLQSRRRPCESEGASHHVQHQASPRIDEPQHPAPPAAIASSSAIEYSDSPPGIECSAGNYEGNYESNNERPVYPDPELCSYRPGGADYPIQSFSGDDLGVWGWTPSTALFSETEDPSLYDSNLYQGGFYCYSSSVLLMMSTE